MNNRYKDYGLEDICLCLDDLKTYLKKLVELKRIELFNLPRMSEDQKEAIANV